MSYQITPTPQLVLLNSDGSITRQDLPVGDVALRDDPETFYYYDFAVDGGGTGTIPLRGPALAAGTFVNAAFIQVISAFTSDGSATVALTTGEAANDIQTAVAYNNAALAAGMHFPAVHKLTTVSRQPSIVIGAAALTGGKIKVLLDTMEGWG